MKRIAFGALLATCSLAAWADDYPYMEVGTTEGASSLPAQGLAITVEDGQLVLTSTESVYRVALSSVNYLAFSQTPTAVRNIEADVEGKAEVFSLDGKRLGSAANAESALQGLRPGLYVVRQNGRTIKVQKQ